MKNFLRAVTIIGILLLLAAPASAQSVEERIREYEKQIESLKSQGDTLSKQISLLDSQIKLSTLQIENTKHKITVLDEEISQLNGEIDRLEELKTKRLELVLHRIPQSYKRSSSSQFGWLLFSTNFSELLARAKYLLQVQEEDTQLYKQLQLTQINYNDRKDVRENKRQEQESLKKQLEVKTKELANQKQGKQLLLDQTRNSEANYQKLLAQARAEQIAIQGIISGGGTEVEVGKVNQGERIASVISGNSCNSSGSHLHFIVEKGGATVNPFLYLKSVSYQNCSGYSCGSEGDPFNPQGDWSWPIDEPIKFTQGYGQTWAVRNTYVGRIYSSHNGIDINGSSATVKAVKPGTLYRGFFSGGGGCKLQYVKVAHADSDIKTYYLHINY